MTYSTPPPNLRSLEQRIRNLETDDTSSLRRQVTMAMVVVGQLLPEGAVKGGTAMALRYGRAESRFTQDLDAARIHPLSEFLDDFEASLRGTERDATNVDDTQAVNYSNFQNRL